MDFMHYTTNSPFLGRHCEKNGNYAMSVDYKGKWAGAKEKICPLSLTRNLKEPRSAVVQNPLDLKSKWVP